MSRIQLTANFYLDEFTRSQVAARHGIDVVVLPGTEVHSNLRRLCGTVLQPLRDALGPVTVTSGYRPPALNRLIGGSPHSQHRHGLAADLVVSGYSPLEVAEWIRRHIPRYDQLIHEFGEWVHVSVGARSATSRNETLTAIKQRGLFGRLRTTYVPGLHPVTERRAA